MEEIIQEGYIEESPSSIPIEDSLKIINQMKNSICRIYTKTNTGTGFFCKINYNSKLIPFLITNNHILEEKDIENNESIKISLYDGERINYKTIIINKERIEFTNSELDVTLIEIKQNSDGIDLNKFLELDDDINVDEEYINTINKSIYILHYPKKKNVSVSYGLISEIKGREIKHLCNTEYGSSGSPILSLEKLKVIGVHIGTGKK